MSASIVNQSAVVMCKHGGTAQPTSVESRVQVDRSPVVTQAATYQISGCALSSSGNPCVTGNFVTAATRVLAGGVPILLQDSQAVCVPNGTGVTITVTKPRVSAQ